MILSTFVDCHENFKNLITFLNKKKINHCDLNFHISCVANYWNDYSNKSINEIYELKEHHSHITTILVETREEELKALWAKYLTAVCELRCNLLKLIRK